MEKPGGLGRIPGRPTAKEEGHARLQQRKLAGHHLRGQGERRPPDEGHKEGTLLSSHTPQVGWDVHR